MLAARWTEDSRLVWAVCSLPLHLFQLVVLKIHFTGVFSPPPPYIELSYLVARHFTCWAPSRLLHLSLFSLSSLLTFLFWVVLWQIGAGILTDWDSLVIIYHSRRIWLTVPSFSQRYTYPILSLPLFDYWPSHGAMVSLYQTPDGPKPSLWPFSQSN